MEHSDEKIIENTEEKFDASKIFDEPIDFKKIYDNNGKRRGGRNYNEILVSRPKIQGVFAYNKAYNHIPEFLRKYAQDNDLPIIIFGNVK